MFRISIIFVITLVTVAAAIFSIGGKEWVFEASPTASPSLSPTLAPSPSPKATPKPTPNPTHTLTPTPTATPVPSPTPTPTPAPASSPATTPSPSPTLTPSSGSGGGGGATPTPSPTPTPNNIVSFVADTEYEDENEGPLIIVVTRDGNIDEEVTVNYEMEAGSAGPDDAALSNGMLTFAPDVTVRTISIDFIDDQSPEEDETFAVRLLSPSSNATLGDHAMVIVTIYDNDGQ